MRCYVARAATGRNQLSSPGRMRPPCAQSLMIAAGTVTPTAINPFIRTMSGKVHPHREPQDRRVDGGHVRSQALLKAGRLVPLPGDIAFQAGNIGLRREFRIEQLAGDFGHRLGLRIRNPGLL